MDTLLVALRISASALLLLFLLVLVWLLWRDFRAVSREVETRTMHHGKLIVMQGNNDGLVTGTTFPLLPLTSLGRSNTNTIHFEDAFTSNVHAFITLRGGRWWLEDQRSSNGTQLNGHRVEQPVIVTTGDTIKIGQVELRIELE